MYIDSQRWNEWIEDAIDRGELADEIEDGLDDENDPLAQSCPCEHPGCPNTAMVGYGCLCADHVPTVDVVDDGEFSVPF